MTFFAYRILPPTAEFWDSLEPEDVGPLVRYLEHLRRLRVDGNHKYILIEADDAADADAIVRVDPAVSEGLMRVEKHCVLMSVNRVSQPRPR